MQKLLLLALGFLCCVTFVHAEDFLMGNLAQVLSFGQDGVILPSVEKKVETKAKTDDSDDNLIKQSKKRSYSISADVSTGQSFGFDFAAWMYQSFGLLPLHLLVILSHGLGTFRDSTYHRDVTGLTVHFADLSLNFGGAVTVEFTEGPDNSNSVTLNGMVGVGLSAGAVALKGSFNVKVRSAKRPQTFSCAAYLYFVSSGRIASRWSFTS